ncbi:MAG: hypothetical protein NHB15_03190 [Methanosarcina barkeri]|nr:hypothetical protein [Methanosarcina sp. ERenArc_MAG2]
MDKCYIYLSCSEKIKIDPEDIGDYLDSLKANVPNSLHKVIDDIRKRSEIELDELLNILHNMSGEKRVEIECIERAEDLDSAKENLSLATVDNCIYVANLDEKDTDKIGYWELGNAYAKEIKIIGYHTGKSNKCDDELERTVLQKSRDVFHFMKLLSLYWKKEVIQFLIIIF